MNEYANLRVKWLPIFIRPDDERLVTIIKEDKMIEVEQLEFVRDVLDTALTGGIQDGDSLLAALDIIQDAIGANENAINASEAAASVPSEGVRVSFIGVVK